MPTKLLSPRGKPITQFDRHRHRRSGTTWPAPSVRPSRGCPRCGQRPTRGLLACVVPGARLSLNLTAAQCTVPAPEPARRTRLTALPSLCAERRPCRLTWSRRLLPDRHNLREAASAGARRPCIVPPAPSEPCFVNPKCEAMHSARIPADPEPHFVVAASSRTQRRVCCYSGPMEQLR